MHLHLLPPHQHTLAQIYSSIFAHSKRGIHQRPLYAVAQDNRHRLPQNAFTNDQPGILPSAPQSDKLLASCLTSPSTQETPYPSTPPTTGHKTPQLPERLVRRDNHPIETSVKPHHPPGGRALSHTSHNVQSKAQNRDGRHEDVDERLRSHSGQRQHAGVLRPLQGS